MQTRLRWVQAKQTRREPIHGDSIAASMRQTVWLAHTPAKYANLQPTAEL